jgi:serine/threonine-protein kinase
MLVGQQFGPFAIEEEIGSGAMGTVYRGRYLKTGRLVALKMIAPGLGDDESVQARFERETAVLKQLKHPNIVRLFATGRYQGTPFYAMEYVEGESLERVLQRRGRLTWQEVVTVGKQICAALQHAHEQGIIHRDLKPSNLMLTADGTVKLTDFGIAKDLDVTQLTDANCTVGTAAYMSPEQCRGERNLTPRSDLYSLGVLLYELLTGRKPFQAETPMDMFMQHVQGTFDRPSRLVLDVPVWLDTLVCQLLEKKPEYRPMNGDAVAQALDRVVDKASALFGASAPVVRARVLDRPRAAPALAETDRAAACTLVADPPGRRKRRARPVHETAWFQAAAVAAVLLAVVGVLYWTFKPAGPEQLVEEARRLLRGEDTWGRARAGPLKEFLRRFPDHPQARQVRQWSDQVELHERDRQLHIRYRQARNLGRPPELESPAEALAYRATHYEDFGDLPAARDCWHDLQQQFATDAGQRLWVLLADQKLQALAAQGPPNPQEKKGRKTLVEKKLMEAIDLKANKQAREARLLCQDIVDLYNVDRYRDDPDLAVLVQQARKLLQ